MGGIPIVSLDKIYLEGENDNIIFLDCTRLDESKNLVSRNDPNNQDSVINQIMKIANKLKRNNKNKIFLVDDVVFSGSVLRTIIDLFNRCGIEVVGIRSSITTKSSYDYFNQNLLYGLDAGYMMSEDVIDQICERDFYFGIVQSGISIKKDGEIFKAPYFKPYGNPVKRASIPEDFEEMFSTGCINRSIILWKEMEKLSKREILTNELPEKINFVEDDKRIVKVLERRK